MSGFNILSVCIVLVLEPIQFSLLYCPTSRWKEKQKMKHLKLLPGFFSPKDETREMFFLL